MTTPAAHLLAHERHIALFVSEDVDRFGQFRISVWIDGKERWGAYLTDRSEESAATNQEHSADG